MELEGKPHRKLKVWQANMDFVTDWYRELEKFPAQEGLTLLTAQVSLFWG